MISYSLEDADLNKLIAWKKAHDCTITEVGAIGGQYTYCFTDTSLGVVIKIQCACGAETDITDYSIW